MREALPEGSFDGTEPEQKLTILPSAGTALFD